MGKSYLFTGDDKSRVYQAAKQFAAEVRSDFRRQATIDRVFLSKRTGKYTTVVSVCGSPIPVLESRASIYQRQITGP